MVFINKNPKVNLGYQIQVCFQIGLHKKDRALLEMIQSYFKGVGNILKQGENLVQYRVTSIKDLEVIVEHFSVENYPLITQKRADFELFKQVLEIVNNKEHLTEEGLKKIVNIKVSMNKGLSDELRAVFPNVKPVSRPVVVYQTIKDPNWLAGFVSGEGSFLISIFKSNTQTGFAVRLIFKLTQHSRDTDLMKSLVDYLNCGRYVAAPSDFNHGDFVVSNLTDITQRIIPFFKKYPVIGNKSLDFSDFCKTAQIMEEKGHTTMEGLDKICKIKKGMNKGR